MKSKENRLHFSAQSVSLQLSEETRATLSGFKIDMYLVCALHKVDLCFAVDYHEFPIESLLFR